MKVRWLLDEARGDQLFAEAAGAAAQEWPSQAQVAGLFFPQDRVVLGYLKESVEACQPSGLILEGLACGRFGVGSLGSESFGLPRCRQLVTAPVLGDSPAVGWYQSRE
jgi:hypothetical protein